MTEAIVIADLIYQSDHITTRTLVLGSNCFSITQLVGQKNAIINSATTDDRAPVAHLAVHRAVTREVVSSRL